jgi:hypothetical protein
MWSRLGPGSDGPVFSQSLGAACTRFHPTCTGSYARGKPPGKAHLCRASSRTDAAEHLLRASIRK